MNNFRIYTNKLIFSFSRQSMACQKESITTTTWGSVNSQEIKKFTLKNRVGQEIDVVTYGATVTAIRTPDKQGNIVDVVLGFDNVEGMHL